MVKYVSNVGTLAEFAISGHTVAIQFDLSIFSANVASWTVQTERERSNQDEKSFGRTELALECIRRKLLIRFFENLKSFLPRRHQT